MNLLLSGAGGLIGSALEPHLAGLGHRVIRLARLTGPKGASPPWWDPERGRLDLGAPAAFDAVIHLAGETIAGRWSAAKKERIRRSRVAGTRLLCEALARLPRPPKTLLSASATGYYGSRGDELLDETSAPGTGFLAEVCQAWEAATQPAADCGIRVVHLRLGWVLARQGGALGKMLPAFRAGLGGRVGSGAQFWSWIALDDLLAAFRHALASERLSGPLNVVTPEAVRNAEFAAALGRVLRRPALTPLPAFAARLLLGEMAEATLLASARVRPARLLETGFQFQFPALEPALRHILGG